MAVEVLPENNVFTGGGEDEFANSTSASESFTMGGGANVINFDLSNNNLLGADEIHLTPGEDLILNFTGSQYYSYFNTSLISWERVNNNDGTVDIVIHTSPYYTLCYVKAETIVSDEIYYQSSYYTYYKAITNYYVYDYEINDWVLNSTNDYAYSQNANTTNYTYGLQNINQAGQLNGWYQGYSDSYDRHEDRYNNGYIGMVTSQIDYDSTLNTIIIKDIGAENAANSVKIQYTNPENGSVQVYKESNQEVNFITRKYDLGSKNEIATEAQVLQGSFLDETFWAGYGDDTITTVGGTNTINLYNGGHDIITLGAGVDFVDATFHQGQAQGHYEDLNTNNITDGGIVIKEGDSADTILLNTDTAYDFYKDGNNLVIIQNYQYHVDAAYGSRARTSMLTVEDYFTAESRIVIKSGYIYDNGYNVYNYEHYYTLTGDGTETPYKITETYMNNNTNEEESSEHELKNLVQGSGTLNGTDNAETIVATNQSTITTGAGADTIYTSSASDTITIDGAGDKHIVIDENSGEDTIVISNHTDNIYLDIINYSGYKLFKNKDGSNDLIIERYREESGHVVKFTGRTIIKDYFTFSNEEKAKIFIQKPYVYWGEPYNQLSVSDLNIEGDEGQANTIYGSDYGDTIVGKELADTIYTGKGVDTITPNQGDDIVNINDVGTKTIYIAKGDGEDTISLSGDALQSYYDGYTRSSWLYLKYTDAFTGLSYQIDGDDNLILYRTYVDGDDIETESTIVTGITGGEVTAANIANYDENGLNISGRLTIYNGTSGQDFAANTPWYIKGSATEANIYNTADDNYVSHLIVGGNGVDTITASGQIEQIFTGAGDDVINVNSTITTNSDVDSLVYAGSGNDTITINGTNKSEIYVDADGGNDTINVESGNAYVHAGDGDDTINVSGGTADIYLGSGADEVNITGGEGGTIHFEYGGGDKTVTFNGASDAQYNIMTSSSSEFYKDGNNLRIEVEDYNYDTHEYDHIETYYINNFFDPNHSKIDPDSTKLGNSSYSTLRNREMNIVGTDIETGGKHFEGTYCRDIIEGTDYVDTITTGLNHDKITPGKGDDIITIGGGGATKNGEKSIFYSKGDGNDTININGDVVFGEYGDDRDPGIRLYKIYGTEDPDKYSYKLDGNNLIIYRTYADGDNVLNESTTITGIRALDENNPADITIENIKNSSGGLNVSGKIYAGTYWDNVSQMNLGNENQSNNMTTTEGVKNTVIGGNMADTITSNGNDDYIVAGAGNDTITTTASAATIYGGTGDDIITSSANTANIYDGAGNDTITVTQGTNYIYLGAGNDTVRISGGQGTIYLHDKCGDNTIIFENNNDSGTCDLSGVYNIDLGSNYGSRTPEKIGDDLFIFRSATETSTITIKGLFGNNQLSDGSKLTINGYTLPSLTVKGVYDKKQKATVFSGSNYSDRIEGTDGKDIITTGGGNDTIYTRKGDDTVIIDGSGNKTINRGYGNDTIKLVDGVDLGYLSFGNSGSYPNENSYQIQGNDLILYRTFIDGDKIDTKSTRITGIKSKTDEPVAITYDNIVNYDGGLNISGKINSGLSPYLLSQGNAKKSNKITTEEGSRNLVLGGKKADKITLNGSYEKVYSGAGADTIILNSSSAEVHAGSGNDKLYANGTGSYTIYSSKGSGNDTVFLEEDFRGYLYFSEDDSPTQKSYKMDKDNNVIIYKTYVDGDKIVNDSIKITGPNASNKVSNLYSYSKNMVMGKAGKANKLTSEVNIQNVVTGGNKNDTVNLKGSYDYAYTSKGNDTIDINTTGYAYVYAGSGKDTINANKGSGNNIYTGKGNDIINITGGSNSIYFKAGEGNDTISFSGSDFGNTSLNFEGYNYNRNYYKSGDDLLIKCTYRDAKGKTKTDTHTIKGYFTNEDLFGNKIYIAGSNAASELNSCGVNILGNYDKKQKATIFEGTDRRDIITGTSKKDIIYTGEGNDRITAGKGNDEIIITGSSINTKYIYLNNGDGNDTIKWADGAEGIAWLYMSPNDVLSYEKSDRNLIITRSYQSGNSVKSETTTIENYYDEDGNPVTYNINGYEYPRVCLNDTPLDPDKSFSRVDYTTSTFNVENDYEFAVGGKNADTVTLTADNSAVFTLAGDDTINVNGGDETTASVTGGTGNDTINLNTTGAVEICHASGDGNDTVYFGENAPSSLKLNIQSDMFNTYNDNINRYMRMSGKFAAIQSGNDLIFSIPKTSAYNAKTETITFKDYFADGVNKPDTILMNLSEYDYHYGSLDYLVRSGLWVEGKQENGVTTYTGFDNIDNYYEYKGKGKTVINGSNDSDSYIVSLNSKSNLYINDKGNIDGSVYDYMYINSDYKNIRALFNVDASGKVVVSADNEYSDNFMLFDKGAFNATNIRNILSGNEGKGVINIDNFFKESDSWYPKGDGNIEYIYASKNILKQCYKDGIYNDNQYMLRPSYWLEDLGQDVANWLATYGDGKYANSSAFDVLQGDNTKDINALLKVYNTVYDKNFST